MKMAVYNFNLRNTDVLMSYILFFISVIEGFIENL
jgi:hypothetical protein